MYNQPVSQKEAQHIVNYALDNGINYIDVAPYYGKTRAETLLGNCLPKNRKSVILSTKVGRYDTHEFDFSATRTKRSIQESLTRLQTDYIDIIFCHDIEFADHDILMSETIPTLAKLKQAGVINHIGISGYPLPLLTKTATHPDISIVLSYGHYNIVNTTLQDHLPTFHNANVDVINASPFCMGLLTKNNCPSWHPYPNKQLLHTKIQTLYKKGIHVTKTAFQFAYHNSNAITTLVGINQLTDLKECLSWISEPPTTQTVSEIQSLLLEKNNLAW
ncbi:hypothetical protein DID76_03915 [Candidatus Marinamargulisbacteria bacterium SCGC AG-414-C22]|nr:hypothetical protein DID76_03915 [Candidatus Marinamargulisbacteria bacterium SCGC AG-414-C22]